MTAVPASERALASAQERGRVDRQLLSALSSEPLVCGVEEVNGGRRPAVRELGGQPAALAWTSERRARQAGWQGDLVEQPASEVAHLLRRTGLALAVNPGEDLGVLLDVQGVAGLAEHQVPAGQEVFLGEAAVPDEELEARLADALAGVLGVRSARIGLLVQGRKGAPHPVVVLSLADRSALAGAVQACHAVAARQGLAQLDVLVDEDLGGLRDAAERLPLLRLFGPS